MAKLPGAQNRLVEQYLDEAWPPMTKDETENLPQCCPQLIELLDSYLTAVDAW